MLLTWVIYIALVIGSVLFFILYKDFLSLILLLVVIAVPILLLIAHLIASARTSVKMEIDSHIITKSQPAKLKITVNNRSVFPVTNIKLVINCKKTLFMTSQKCRFKIWAKPKSELVFEYDLRSDSVGRLELDMKSAVLYDMIRLFQTRKKINLKSAVSVIPDGSTVKLSFGANSYLRGESERFSKHKPGDDPSEVFQIRDYAEGDKLNRIHWKLSSKTDDALMVKDYSLPLNESVMLYLDMTCDHGDARSVERINTVFETVFSISVFFIDHGISHNIGWYSAPTDCFFAQKITSIDELYAALSLIYNCTVYSSAPGVAESDIIRRIYSSHLVYVSSDSDNSAAKYLSESDLRSISCTLMRIVDDSSDIPADEASTGINIIQVVNGKVDISLHDAMI